MGELETLVQQKLDADTDFQNSLADLSDEEKTEKLNAKRSEILENEFGSLREKSSKNEELANNYKIRAEKAEKGKKPANDGGEPSEKKDDKDALSTKDVLTLTKANVHEDDVEWLLSQRKAVGKDLSALLKDDEINAVLKLRNEKRKTADAANTKPARPGNRKPDGETLKKELLSDGKVPEPGSDEAEELFWARRGGKPSK